MVIRVSGENGRLSERGTKAEKSCGLVHHKSIFAVTSYVWQFNCIII